jgi:hypothetical protein
MPKLDNSIPPSLREIMDDNGEIEDTKGEVGVKDKVESKDKPIPSSVSLPTKAERLAKFLACANNLFASDLDYVFDIANGKAPSDDNVAMEFFGIKEE